FHKTPLLRAHNAGREEQKAGILQNSHLYRLDRVLVRFSHKSRPSQQLHCPADAAATVSHTSWTIRSMASCYARPPRRLRLAASRNVPSSNRWFFFATQRVATFPDPD